MAAMELMQACGITACALIVASEYSFTVLERMDSRAGELVAGL